MAEQVNYKRVTDLEMLDAVQESDTVIVERDGVLKRVPGGMVGGGKLPEPTGGNMMFVTNADGEQEWVERTCYVDSTTLNMFADFTATTDGDGLDGIWSFPLNINIFPDENFRYNEPCCSVIIDGVTYEWATPYVTGGSTLMLGNLSDEYPFRIKIIWASSMRISSLETTLPGTSHDVQIGTLIENVKKLDAKFLPKSVKTVNWSDPDEDGNVYIDIPTDDHINSLIDAKLSEILNAEEVSF